MRATRARDATLRLTASTAAWTDPLRTVASDVQGHLYGLEEESAGTSSSRVEMPASVHSSHAHKGLDGITGAAPSSVAQLHLWFQYLHPEPVLRVLVGSLAPQLPGATSATDAAAALSAVCVLGCTVLGGVVALRPIPRADALPLIALQLALIGHVHDATSLPGTRRAPALPTLARPFAAHPDSPVCWHVAGAGPDYYHTRSSGLYPTQAVVDGDYLHQLDVWEPEALPALVPRWRAHLARLQAAEGGDVRAAARALWLPQWQADALLPPGDLPALDAAAISAHLQSLFALLERTDPVATAR